MQFLALLCALAVLAAQAASLPSPTNASSPSPAANASSVRAAAVATAYKPNFQLTNPRGTELSASLVFVSMGEVQYKCREMVDRAWATGSRRVQIVPTIHWKGSATKVNNWCYREWGTCTDVKSWDQIWYFKWILSECIKYSVEKGFRNIYVLPHNDVDCEPPP